LKPKTSSKKLYGIIAALLGLTITTANIIFTNNLFAQVINHQPTANRAYNTSNPYQSPTPIPASAPIPSPIPSLNPNPNPNPNLNPADFRHVSNPASLPPLSIEQARAISSQKLYEARRAVAARDIAHAERIINDVQKLNLQYQPAEDRPEAIIALIKQHHSLDEFARANGTTEQFRRNFAMFLLSQANSFLNYGDAELAENLNNTAIAQNVLYNEMDNRNGLTPQAVAKRIIDVKNYRASIAAQNLQTQLNANSTNAHPQLSLATQKQLDNAIVVMKSAREAINNEDIERARNLCLNVKNMQLPDSLFPNDVDNPTKLLGEIAIRSQSIRQPIYSNANANANLNAANSNANLNAKPNANSNAKPNADPNQIALATNVTNNTGSVNNINNANNNSNNNELSNAVYNEQKDTTRTRHATSLPDTSDFIEQAKQARGLALQQLSSEIIRMISEARRLTNEHRHDEAIEILNKARQRIDDAQIDDTTKITFYKNVEEAVSTTHKHIDQNKSRSELDAKNQEVWSKLKNESEMARSREEQIKTYVDECTRLTAAQDYDQAIIMAKKLREFAPNEPVTKLLLQHTQMLANVRRSEQNRDLKAETVLESLHRVDETASLDQNLFRRDISFSNAWDNIKKRKSFSDLLYDRPETEKQIIRKLETPISFSIDRPIAFREFIDMLRAQTGLNIDVDWNALEEAFIRSDSPVSFHLNSEIKLKNVLNQILGQKGLAYVVKNEMLNITSAKQARGRLERKTHYIGDLIRQAPDFDGSSPHDMINSIERAMRNQPVNQNNPNQRLNPAVPFSYNGMPSNMPYPNGVAVNPNSTPSMIQAQYSSGTPNGNGTTFTNNPSTDQNQNGAAGGGGADYDMIINLIKNVTSWKDNESEGAEITPFEPNMSIVVRQTEEVHTEIVELLAQLRKLSDLQIAVEVRYITISDDYYEKMGVDFQAKLRNDGAANKVVLYGDNSSSSDSSDSSDSSSSTSTSSSSSTSGGIAKGNNVTVGLQGPSQFQFDLSIPISQNTYGLADPMYGGFNPDSGLRMGFALLSDIEAYFFMSATQGDSRSNVLQAPKVMIFNGQMGSVVDSTQSPFVTSVVPVVGDFAIGYQPIIAVLNEGQMLNVRGTVSPNRQYVRLTLNPLFNTITKVSTFRYVGDENATDSTTTDGSEASNGTAASADEKRGTVKTTTRATSGVTIQQPIMASFSVQTTVSVPDGGTILMGGIKRLREGRIESGTPILDKIPFIQRLFMNTAIGRDTSSILMVVTPRIIIQEEEEEFITGVRP
jgi:general secretion pathway protein D